MNVGALEAGVVVDRASNSTSGVDLEPPGRRVMRSPRFPLVLLFLSVFMGAPAWAQTASVKGKVTHEDGSPFPGVLVEVGGTSSKATAGPDGEYSIDAMAPGSYTLRASVHQYRTETASITVAAGQTVSQDFSMTLDLLALERIVVTGI